MDMTDHSEAVQYRAASLAHQHRAEDAERLLLSEIWRALLWSGADPESEVTSMFECLTRLWDERRKIAADVFRETGGASTYKMLVWGSQIAKTAATMYKKLDKFATALASVAAEALQYGQTAMRFLR